jgi:hypothetical protein
MWQHRKGVEEEGVGAGFVPYLCFHACDDTHAERACKTKL